MDSSPNALIAPDESKVRAVRLSRWPLYVVLLGGVLGLAALVYSVNFAHKPESDGHSAEVDIVEPDVPLLVAGAGRSRSPLPPSITEQGTSDPALPSVPDPLLVVQTENPAQQDMRQEWAELRRRRIQSQLEAMSTPLGVKRFEAVGSRGPGTPEPRPESAPVNPHTLAAGPSYDASAQKDKESFFARAKQDGEWVLPSTRTPGRQYELKTDRIIPAAMITGINSDLPGQIQAQVTRDVYDTATGAYLLIPRGSKLTGTYDSRVVYGQSRVLMAWTRLIYPDGSSVSLGAMPGADAQGYAGAHDLADNHYIRIFGSALLMSLVTGGMAYSVDSLDGSHSENNTPTLQQQLGSALAQQLGQTTLTMLERNLNIAPTLEIRPGYRFNIIVTKDIVFEKPYRPLQ